MRKTTIALLLALFVAADATAEVTTKWWGLVSFRQRHETTEKYVSFENADSTKRGELERTIDNSTTKLGYQFGMRMDVRDNLFVGITFRSGLSGGALVMQQGVTSREGLLPGLQEAFVNWDTPFLTVEFGKIPQAGTAMWDVYAASLQTDFRADDPRDGIFADRMAALNGLRVSRTIGFATLRGIFHTDHVGGFYEKYDIGNIDHQRSPDRNTSVLGATLNFGDKSLGSISTMPGLKGLVVDVDYGFPKRAAKTGTNVDSTYADETLWGATIKETIEAGSLQIGYGYNWRDSVFTISYLDAMAQFNWSALPFIHSTSLEAGDLSFTVRYQQSNQELEFDPYRDAKIYRDAWHFYLNKTVGGIDLQPRMILFNKEIEDFKQEAQTRYELTGTVRF